MSQRDKVAAEIYTSEATYVERMETLVKLFLDPLEVEYKFASPIQQLFSTARLIAPLNKEFLAGLRERIENWSAIQRIGDVFLRFGPYFRMYTSYVNSFDSALKELRILQENNKKFQNWLVNKETEIGNTLSDNLILPIQRIPRYKMLLGEVLKYTEVSHPDHAALTQALDLVNQIATHVNESKRSQEHYDSVFQLQKQFLGEVNIIDKGRLIRSDLEWVLEKTKVKPKERKAALFFFDELLIAAKIKKDNRYKVVALVPVNKSLQVMPIPDDVPNANFSRMLLVGYQERGGAVVVGSSPSRVSPAPSSGSLHSSPSGILHPSAISASYRGTKLQKKFDVEHVEVDPNSPSQPNGIVRWSRLRRISAESSDNLSLTSGEVDLSSSHVVTGAPHVKRLSETPTQVILCAKNASARDAWVEELQAHVKILGGRDLLLAATRGLSKEIETILRIATNVNFRDKEGYTPLMAAATSGSVDCVELLLKNKASVDDLNANRHSALSLAIKNSQTKVVECLLQRQASPLARVGKNNMLAIEVAHMQRKFDLVPTLLPPTWFAAASTGDLQAMKLVVALTAKTYHPPLNYTSSRAGFSEAFRTTAAQLSRERAMLDLTASGPGKLLTGIGHRPRVGSASKFSYHHRNRTQSGEVNSDSDEEVSGGPQDFNYNFDFLAPNPMGMTALTLAIQGMHVEIVDYLLGAPGSRRRGFSMPTETQSEPTSTSGDSNGIIKSNPPSPKGATTGIAPGEELVLCRVNQQDNRGRGAMHWCALADPNLPNYSTNLLKIAKALLNAKADPGALDVTGRTPFEVGHGETLHSLLANRSAKGPPPRPNAAGASAPSILHTNSLPQLQRPRSIVTPHLSIEVPAGKSPRSRNSAAISSDGRNGSVRPGTMPIPDLPLQRSGRVRDLIKRWDDSGSTTSLHHAAGKSDYTPRRNPLNSPRSVSSIPSVSQADRPRLTRTRSTGKNLAMVAGSGPSSHLPTSTPSSQLPTSTPSPISPQASLASSSSSNNTKHRRSSMEKIAMFEKMIRQTGPDPPILTKNPSFPSRPISPRQTRSPRHSAPASASRAVPPPRPPPRNSSQDEKKQLSPQDNSQENKRSLISGLRKKPEPTPPPSSYDPNEILEF